MSSLPPDDIDPEDVGPFITMADAAAFLAISRASLYGMAHRGEAQLLSIAGRTVMRRDELRRLAASAQVWAPTSRRKRTRSTA